MIAIICAICAGVSIVFSRSVNAYLAEKVGAYQSSFFNYLTGLLMSIVFLIILGFSEIQTANLNLLFHKPVLLIGGFIGVFNILILNIVVLKISPVKLTLLTFISQLLSGILLDYCIYDMLSICKLAGCLIVTGGLIFYELCDEC